MHKISLYIHLLIFPLLLVALVTIAFPAYSAKVDCFSEGFGISLATDKVAYTSEESIIITLKLFNYTEDTLRFTFTSSQRYDFMIQRDEKPIWCWSEGQFFAQVMGTEIIEPGETITYREVCSPDMKLSPGRYALTGIITCRENPFQATINIRVK